MKYIVAISLVSLLALTSCFERQEPAPIVDETDVIEDTSTPEDDDMMMPEDDDMMWEDEDDNMMDMEAEVEAEATLDDDEMDEIEEDLEALFQDILGDE